MLYIKDQKCTFWKAEDKGTYALVSLSTSRKDKKSDEWKNSNWSFVRFVSKAYEKIDKLDEKDRIVIQAGMSREKYKDKEGKEVWPSQPQMVVFNWDFVEKKAPVEPDDEAPTPDPDEFPF
jgi:hypothetical protein